MCDVALQAYTVELEAEVSQLKEENMRLRKHQVCTRGPECVRWFVVGKAGASWQLVQRVGNGGGLCG